MNVLPQQQSREQAAREQAGRTNVRPAAARTLAALFLLMLSGVSLWNLAAQRRLPPAVRPSPLEPFRAQGFSFRALLAANRILLRQMDDFEQRLDDESPLGRWIRPRLQAALLPLGLGNEQVYPGRDGWLFFRPDVDLVAGPGFLRPRQLARRRAAAPEWQTLPQPDPLPAILDFHRQLAARGIALVLVPVPSKAAIHPERLAPPSALFNRPPGNPSRDDFLRLLRNADVLVFDPADLLFRFSRDSSSGAYLATDTHWRPEAMDAVALHLARFLRDSMPLAPAVAPPARLPLPHAAQGDLVPMLDLPPAQSLYPPESVELFQVLDSAGFFWRPSENAEVLLLGDSFSNVFSLEALGWGEAAGFAEQLSHHLGAPLDRIARNDAGARATRDMLAAELARGRDRLAGKKVVVWQFAERELAFGDWPLIPMQRRDPVPSAFFVPSPGESPVVAGRVRAVSPIPRPGSVPYRDHVAALHLVDLPDRRESVVYFAAMLDNQWTPAARLRPGADVSFRLRPWNDVAHRWDAVNRSELDDPALQLQEPCWGEWIQPGDAP